MLKFICLLFGIHYCHHNYEVIDKKYLVDEDDDTIGIIYIQKCSKCGKIKKVEV